MDERVFGVDAKGGEGRNRTGDTTVFSRVLYQLSYLAARGTEYRTPPGHLAAGSASVAVKGTLRGTG